MIDSDHTSFYMAYAAIVVALIVCYLKIKSTEGVMITTKEFKKFQYGFLGGYGTIITAELIAVGSFFFIMMNLALDIEQITKVYITTIVSTTVWGILIEIFDIGSRRTKCALSAFLYGLSLFFLYFGGHYEMVLLSRVVFGAASALHHSSFEAYIIHQHTILGFPDDWLSQTFSMLPHVMAIAAIASGPVGQLSATVGAGGCITVIIILSMVTVGYILVNWDKDTNPPRYMYSNFLYTMTNTVSSIKSNSTIRHIILVGAFFEASVIIFSFYWAPWLKFESAGNPGFGALHEVVSFLPYEIIFSCYICASMLGNYLFQMYTAGGDETGGNGINTIFHYVLLGSTACYFVGSTISSPMLVFATSLVIHILMGAYWSCIGILRAQYIPPEYRTSPITVTRY